MEQPINEFRSALDAIQACTATLRCGCSVSELERDYAFYLKRAAKEYLRAFENWYDNELTF